MKSRIVKALCALGISGLVAWGCGAAAGGGIGGTGIAQGIIAAFGSIVVNDIRFEITSADIQIDGVQAAEADLKRGMVVTVTGTINEAAGTGIADVVTADSLIRGPVDSVNPSTGIVFVLGQGMVVNGDTFYEGTTLATLTPGTVVEVNGLTDAVGDISATRIRVIPGGSVSEFTGRIREFNAQAQTFRIRRLLVDFSTATILSTPPGGLGDGQIAKVTVTQVSNGTAIADTIRSRTREFELVAGARLRLEGFITEFIDGDSFVVNDQVTVRTSPRTNFVGDIRPVTPNVRLRIDGQISADLSLDAERIEVHKAGESQAVP